jgi:ribonuclease PH
MTQGPTVLRDNVAAISCGIYRGTPVLDLDYAEDSRPTPTPTSS